MTNQWSRFGPSTRIMRAFFCATASLLCLVTGCGKDGPDPNTSNSTSPTPVRPALEETSEVAHSRAGQRDLDPALSESEREIIERFGELVSEKKATTFRSNKWLGIPNLQYPTDAWIVQEMIFELQPDFIVETGTYHGGSAAMWAMVLEHANPQGRVISIDIRDRSQQARKLAIVRERVDFVLGSSTDPQVIAHVAERVRGTKVMVILDSDHTRDHVLSELEAYAPLVPVGSYVIVQDTGGIMVGKPHPGPRRAVDDFLASHPEFKPDRQRERMLLTMHPKGYLRRIF